MGPHPSHVTRISDASTFDEICVNCGAHDEVPGGWGQLALPCTAAMLDEEGYPTQAALDRIINWPWRQATACLDFVRSIWHWGEDWANENVSDNERVILMAEEGDRFARFATGGWSGNEELIRALNQNQMVRVMCWKFSARGGLHIYQYPKKDA